MIKGFFLKRFFNNSEDKATNSESVFEKIKYSILDKYKIKNENDELLVKGVENFCYLNGEKTLLCDLKRYDNALFTGAFDLIHDGHIKQITTASSVCRHLFVGVSTDEVIKGYKFADPVVPFEARQLIVQGVKGVYKAVPQEDLYGKMEMCSRYNIDAIVTSDEYLEQSYEDISKMSKKEQSGVERWKDFQEEANKNGIDIIYLPRALGLCVSSSRLKEEIISSQPVEKGDLEVIVPESEAEVNVGQMDIDLINYEKFATYGGCPIYSEGEDCQ